jgi:hypothetical protein
MYDFGILIVLHLNLVFLNLAASLYPLSKMFVGDLGLRIAYLQSESGIKLPREKTIAANMVKTHNPIGL